MVGGGLEQARQVEVEVLDFGLASPFAQYVAQEFSVAIRTFRTNNDLAAEP